MTTAIATPGPIARRAGRPRHDWGRAVRALQRLFADKEDTSQVFAIMWALNGRAHAEDYARLLSTPDGGRIAYERVEFAGRLMDEAWVASFPAGSVGAAYRDFITAQHFTPQGMIDESHKGIPDEELDARHPYAWWFRRMRDVHDVWHVLTGYGRDALGEICMVAFSYQETRGPGWALIAVGGLVRCHGPARWAARRAIIEARGRARRAAWLPALDYERLMFEPLGAARARLGLTPPRAYEAVSPELRDLAVV